MKLNVNLPEYPENKLLNKKHKSRMKMPGTGKAGAVRCPCFAAFTVGKDSESAPDPCIVAPFAAGAVSFGEGGFSRSESYGNFIRKSSCKIWENVIYCVQETGGRDRRRRIPHGAGCFPAIGTACRASAGVCGPVRRLFEIHGTICAAACIQYSFATSLPVFDKRIRSGRKEVFDLV